MAHAGNFKPGQSGNPGGRAKGRERALVAIGESLQIAGSDAAMIAGLVATDRTQPITAWTALVERLFAIALDGATEPRDVAAIAKVLLPYRFGQPKQEVEISGVTPEQAAVLDALHMTPHERRKRQDELDDAEPTEH